MTPSALDLLPTIPMDSSYNISWTCFLTGVLCPIYVLTLPIKCVHISLRTNRITSYHLNEQVIPKPNSHRDLGVIISDDLPIIHIYYLKLTKLWVLFVTHSSLSSHFLSIKTKLYMTLVCAILTYCYLAVWRLCLLNDTNSLERIQCHATKYVLNDYTNDYKSRLINLNIVPLNECTRMKLLIYCS